MKATIYPVKAATPHRLAIIARPRGDDWLCDEIAALSREGINVLVSMLTPEEADELGLNGESAECTSAGMAFFNIPISDRSVPNERDEFLRHVDAITELVRQGRSVGIHCRASIGRSSLLAVSLLVRLGWGADKAFDAVESARGCAIPDTLEQRCWVIQNVLPQAGPGQ